jgi:hypothetical protein
MGQYREASAQAAKRHVRCEMTTMNDRAQAALLRDLAEKVIPAALSIPRDSGKELPLRGLKAKIANTVRLDKWAREHQERTGDVRWESILH